MFNDPYYGLRNSDNYFHWNALLETADPLESVAWYWELNTYFGLSILQIEELTENFRDSYADAMSIVI